MRKEIFRIAVGTSVVLVHSVCFILVFTTKGDYLTQSQMIDIALLLAPISVAYFAAVVRSAISRQTELSVPDEVNLNYGIVVGLVTVISLGALLWTVLSIQDASETSKRLISAFEIVFGATFGLIVSDLFGEVKYVDREDEPPVGPQKDIEAK